MNLFATKSVDGIIAESEGGQHHLKRTLGAGNLIALGIGAIIGSGLFSLTGVTAAQNSGPAVVLSMAVAAIGCAFAGLCYSEFSCMIPVAGSAYTYAYTTLGEWIAWIIGWDLVLEYAVGSATVSISWSAYVVSLLHSFGIELPPQLIAGPFEQLKLPDGTMVQGIANIPAVIIVFLISMLLMLGIKEQRGDCGGEAGGGGGVHRHRLELHQPLELSALHPAQHGRVRPFRIQRHHDGRGHHLLRIYRLRRGFDGGAGMPQSAKTHADRDYRVAGDLHDSLRALRTCFDRNGVVHQAGRGRTGRAGHRPDAVSLDE
jgi:hypothetical protein